jgi:hypothetical protein
LGGNARRAIETQFSLDVYATTLSRHLDELAEAGSSVRPHRGLTDGRATAVRT